MKQRNDVPPEPPQIPRRLSFGATQLVGIPLLLALPLLALFGAFGITGGEVMLSGPGLEVRVSYPERFRYKTIHPLDIHVRNTGAALLPRVLVSVDRAYLSAFSEARFTPEAKAVTERGFLIELGDIPPGGESHVTGSVQAEAYGRHRGTVSIATDAGARLEAKLSTIVFP